MFNSLWRTLRKNYLGPSGGEKLSTERHASSRPQLEALEDRVMPTLLPGVAPPIASPTPPPAAIAYSGSFSNLQTLTAPPAGSANQMTVTVAENSPESVINMDLVFAEMIGLQHQDGLQFSLLCNTNTSLVKTDLSESDLTLQYAPGQYGLSTVTVGATDADGVSMQESILVTVVPVGAMSTGTPPPPTGTTAPPTTAALV